MKTEPMEHQIKATDKARGEQGFAYIAEQGTGKTWMMMKEMEERFLARDVQGAVVIAPNGVHTNWVKRQFPQHFSEPWVGARYRSGAGVRETRVLRKVLRQDPSVFYLLSVNVEALTTKRGKEMIEEFLDVHDAGVVIDESHYIKNPNSGRTKEAIRLGAKGVYRRAATGTMMDKPVDVFSQFEFLAPGQGWMGTTSYRAFVAEFAELLPPDHPLIESIKDKSPRRGRFAATPQIVKRVGGKEQWKNLDKMRDLIAAHSYRVLKKDCLDLPDKTYKAAYFTLTPPQRKIYEEAEKNLRFQADGGELTTFNKLAALAKLRQITSGFIMVDGEPMGIMEDNPRTKLLMNVLEPYLDDGKSVLIWAFYREEIAQIERHLKKREISVVSYHGGVGDEDREAALDQFQSGAAQVFLANAATAGEGLDLYQAQVAIYYSNEFSLIKRQQSEDRNHRFGFAGETCLYLDLVAENTKDEQVSSALQNKKDVAEYIFGDN